MSATIRKRSARVTMPTSLLFFEDRQALYAAGTEHVGDLADRCVNTDGNNRCMHHIADRPPRRLAECHQLDLPAVCHEVEPPVPASKPLFLVASEQVSLAHDPDHRSTFVHDWNGTDPLFKQQRRGVLNRCVGPDEYDRGTDNVPRDSGALEAGIRLAHEILLVLDEPGSQSEGETSLIRLNRRVDRS